MTMIKSLSMHNIADYITKHSGIYIFFGSICISGRITELRPSGSTEITIHQLQNLSDCLFTEKININVGYSSTPGYSEYTPGSPGSKGYIQCIDVDWDKVEAAIREGK